MSTRLRPDNDPAGTHYAQSVAQILRQLDAKVEIVEAAALGLGKKGDCVDWMGTHQGADTAAIEALPLAGPPPRETPRSLAAQWLQGLLTWGPIPAQEVLRLGEVAGYSPRTLHRAKTDLGILSMRAAGAWSWCLWESPEGRKRNQRTSRHISEETSAASFIAPPEDIDS